MSVAGGLETGVIYCDDNLPRLAQLPAESIDLIYLDPPFFSNRHYEVIWGDEAEVRSFEDRWQGGIHVYVDWMRERTMEMWRILKPTGSLYLHCDWHASHYLKVMLDDVCGYQNFQNEAIWYYKGAGVSPKRWARRHDAILFYTKGKTWTFNVDPVRDEYAQSTKERFSHYIGNVRDGHDFGLQTLNPGGKHPDDVWQIKIVAPSARARLGYPTQKPADLLRRIILASSNEDDIVLDPFAGCGTAITVAQELGRRWIGIDISPTAVELMRRQLVKIGAPTPKLVGMPVSPDALKNLKPFEFQNWVIQRLNGTHSPKKSGDMGIDGYSFFLHEPIQVKQSDHIGRNVVDNFETAVQRSGKQKGYIIGFSFTRGAYEECARAKKASGLEIELIKVSDLLRDVTSLITPVGGRRITSAPLPPPRRSDTLPSADDLIKSDQQSA